MLIEKQDAINAIKGRYAFDQFDRYAYQNIGLEWAIEAVDEVSPVKCWIPVSERLPASDDYVIVSIRDESCDNPYEYTAPGWYGDGHWIIDNEFRYDVVAWMPLPKPWRGDN